MPDQHLAFRADDRLADALAAEVARQGTTLSDVIRAPLAAAYCAPRPSYGPGSRFSLVRDVWAFMNGGEAEPEAKQRIGQFRAELAASRAEFALTTANTSQAVGPGYAPLVAEEGGDRPLRALCTVLPLSSPVPFGVPGAVAASAVAAHVEGVNPSSGTLALGGGTVAPTGVSGVFDVSRELADSANPAVDAVALAAMAEDYARKTEALVAAELAAITSGTITSGQVSTGAQVATTAAGTVAADTKKLIARAVKLRRRPPQAAVATADSAFAEALAAGLDETTGDENALWRPMGVPTNLSADLASGSGSTAVVAVAPTTAWAWESETQRFEWEQVSGPAVVRLALFGYFGVRVVRPVGVAALRVS